MAIPATEVLHAFDEATMAKRPPYKAVSYTHLTLPTNREV